MSCIIAIGTEIEFDRYQDEATVGYAVYVLTEVDEGTVIDGPVQVVEAPLEDDGHDAEIRNRIDLILETLLIKDEGEAKCRHGSHLVKVMSFMSVTRVIARKSITEKSQPENPRCQG